MRFVGEKSIIRVIRGQTSHDGHLDSIALDHKAVETPERMDALFWQIVRPSLVAALGRAP
jgi:hypothetical protein